MDEEIACVLERAIAAAGRANRRALALSLAMLYCERGLTGRQVFERVRELAAEMAKAKRARKGKK